MCGILGYLGNDDFRKYILTGLALIQNRGYDSVGVSFIKGENICTVKKASVDTHDSLNTVTELVNAMDCGNSSIAIGHTRWATHGGKTDINAHPHADMNNNLVLCHNGVIENYLELKEMLSDNGYHFVS